MNSEFLSIPHRKIDGKEVTFFDPYNRAHVASLIRQADAHFKRSARFWEYSQNGRATQAERDENTKREQEEARIGEEMLAPLGIRCDWPGLYPSFRVKGFEEHSTRSAVLAALGRPFSWLPAEVENMKGESVFETTETLERYLVPEHPACGFGVVVARAVRVIRDNPEFREVKAERIYNRGQYELRLTGKLSAELVTLAKGILAGCGCVK